MNHSGFNLHEKIELLALRELSKTERQELFAYLDQQPQYWKDCTLALLEHQALCDSLSHGKLCIAEINEQLQLPQKADGNSKDLKVQRNKVWRWVLNAAALIAFGLTAFLLGDACDLVPQQNYSTTEASGDNAKNGSSLYQSDDGLYDQVDLARKVNLAMQTTGVDDFEVIAFVGIKEALETKVYPIIKSPTLENKLTHYSPQRLNTQIKRRLKRDGWELSSHQQFVSIELPGKERATMPVAMLNCQYVGRELF